MLNANHIDEEAEIVAQAGQLGRVTVSTNMAGRGTDIKLGEGVAELGGLHVICTEMHDAGPHRPPAQRPLRPPGRSGHLPPVPGAGRRAAGGRLRSEEGRRSTSISASGRRLAATATPASSAARRRKVERRHFRDRRALMYFEKQRKKMQRQMGQDPYLDSPS